jgi:hypothetical protein
MCSSQLKSIDPTGVRGLVQSKTHQGCHVADAAALAKGLPERHPARSQAIRMPGSRIIAKMIIKRELNGFDTSEPSARPRRFAAMPLRFHEKETFQHILLE